MRCEFLAQKFSLFLLSFISLIFLRFVDPICMSSSGPGSLSHIYDSILPVPDKAQVS